MRDVEGGWRGGEGNKSYLGWCTIIPHCVQTISHLDHGLGLSLDDNLCQVCQALAVDDGEGYSVLRENCLELHRGDRCMDLCGLLQE